MIFISLLIVFSSLSSYAKTQDELKYHIRERHDINFMNPYQFVVAFKYLYKNDPIFTAKHGLVTIDNLVQFSHEKAKGVCFNQVEMSTDTGRNQVYKYIADLANMTDINDYWVDYKTRKMPVGILQITGKRGGYTLGVWLDTKNYDLQTAFPDGYPDGNNSKEVGNGIIIKEVKKYYQNNILINESKIKAIFNTSLDWVEDNMSDKNFESIVLSYNALASTLIKAKLLNKLNPRDKTSRIN